MRTIKFKSENSDDFRSYIDIGSCERDYYSVNIFLPGEKDNKSGKIYFKNYSCWFENFKKESIGSKMLILNYYLFEYMGWAVSENKPNKVYFESMYGEKTTSVISSNLDYLLKFNNRWFEVQSNLFKGLDLNWEDIEEQFSRVEETEDGLITEIEFDDGSIILFLDEDDTFRSFYVPEEDYSRLKEEIDIILSLFQPY